MYRSEALTAGMFQCNTLGMRLMIDDFTEGTSNPARATDGEMGLTATLKLGRELLEDSYLLET